MPERVVALKRIRLSATAASISIVLEAYMRVPNLCSIVNSFRIDSTGTFSWCTFVGSSDLNTVSFGSPRFTGPTVSTSQTYIVVEYSHGPALRQLFAVQSLAKPCATWVVGVGVCPFLFVCFNRSVVGIVSHCLPLISCRSHCCTGFEGPGGDGGLLREADGFHP
jgi:hypothetical protein